MKKGTRFHGILTIGKTQEEAINRYRLLAMGKGAVAKVDAGHSVAFITTASDDMPTLFNPKTGELDLRTSKKILANLQFETTASDAEVTTNHYHCAALCGQHIVYDSATLLKHCPVCTEPVTQDPQSATATAEMDEEDEAHEAEMDALDAEAEAEIDAELDDLDDDEDSDEDDEDADEDEDDSDEDSDEDEDLDDEDADEDDESDEDEDEDDESLSSDDDEDEDEDDEDSDDEDDEDEDDESTSSSDDEDQPLVIAADSRDQAIQLYREQRAGSGTATASVNYLMCPGEECQAHVLTEDPSTTDCPSCSTKLVEPAPGSVVASDESGIIRVAAEAADDDEDDEDEDEDDEDMSVVDEDDDEDDDEDEDDESESSDDEPIEPAKARKAVANNGGEGEQNAPGATPTPAPETGTAEPAVAPTPSPSTQQPDQPAPAQTIEGDAVNVDMLQKLNDADPEAHKQLDVAFSSVIAGKPIWTAYFQGTPIATARAEDVGQNADLFPQPAFGHAVIASAKHVGVKATLKEMGFKPIVATALMPKHVKEQVEAQMVEARAALNTEKEQFSERLLAALATSAIGINRGFFDGLENPVKAQLWNALSSAGIKQPELLIDNAFKNSADAYHRTLFAKANEILANPPEVQESLSKAVLGTAYQSVSSAGRVDMPIEARLENFGTSVSSAAPAAVPEPQKATASAQPAPVAPTAPQHVAAVVGSLGRRR